MIERIQTILGSEPDATANQTTASKRTITLTAEPYFTVPASDFEQLRAFPERTLRLTVAPDSG